MATRSGQSPTPDAEPLVKVTGVSKKFCRDLKKSLWYGVQDIGSELVGRQPQATLRQDEFWAVRDISFELYRGQCLGLIGHNGAGKTTLLKMLNGLIKPDRGRIEMRGRVGALIALGTGFNPVLTGRENIYVNASILGISKKEIDAKMEEIIDFAEIADFIDAPVQSYSSGMTVRLGFAVASRLNPDILIIDEVLAVGDIAFKIKCYNEIYRLVKHSAVILVSHSMAQIARISSHCLVMDHGKRAMMTDNVAQGIDCYNQMAPSLTMTQMGDGRATLEKMLIATGQGEKVTLDLRRKGPAQVAVRYRDRLTLAVAIRVDPGVRYIRPQFNFLDIEQRFVAQLTPPRPIQNRPGRLIITATVDQISLNQGTYSLGLNLYKTANESANSPSESILIGLRDILAIKVHHNSHLGAAPVQLVGHWRTQIRKST